MKERMYKLRRVIVVIVISLLITALCLTGCGKEQKEQGPIILTYATFNLDIEIEQWIAEWNQSQEDYRIEIREYENDDAGHTLLNNEIVSGQVPDILDLSDINTANFISKGILTDLSPYLDADKEISRDDLVSSILETYTENNKLYGIPLGYRFETLLGKKELVGEASDWTTDKMIQITKNLEADEHLLDGLAPLGLLRAVLATDMGSYVDWEKGECSFDSEKFRELLELAAAVDLTFMTQEELDKKLADGSLLLDRAYISCVSDYQSSIEQFAGSTVSWVGFPSEDGGKAVLHDRMPVGITESSQNKEGAWQFVSSLLGEEFQRYHIKFVFPIRLDILQESFQEAMKEKDPEMFLGGEPPSPATREEIDALFEGICNAQSNRIFDSNIWNIVAEDAEAYYEGNKTIEEVMDLIQGRVSIYVSENY